MILLDPGARPIIAHRGASGEYPENTLLAFAKAIEQGADALELDVRVTRDGVPVVLHDAALDRTTDRSGPVEELPWQEVRQANAGGAQTVPSLAQVLEEFPATPLVIEIKTPRAALPVLSVLRAHCATDRVVVGAFERAALAPFDRTEVARAAARSEVARFWLAARWPGRTPRASWRAFTVPRRFGWLHVADRPFLAAARRCRLPVHVWTVDELSEAEHLRELGVCGIMTNFPARMRGLARS